MALIKIGVSLMRLSDNTEVANNERLPWRIVTGNTSVNLDKVGLVVPDQANPTHKVVERWEDSVIPANVKTRTEGTPVYDQPNDRMVVPVTYVAYTQQELDDLADAAKEDNLNKLQQNEIYKIIFEALYNHESRIRVLASQPPITKADFRAILKSLI